MQNCQFYLVSTKSWKLNLNELLWIERSMMITSSAHWLGNDDACSVTCLEDISFVHAASDLTDQSGRKALWSEKIISALFSSGRGLEQILDIEELYLSFLCTHKKLISTISVATVFVRIVAGIAEINPTIFFVVEARTAQSQSVCHPGGLRAHFKNSGE